MPFHFNLAAATAGHAVWWWLLGIVAVIGIIWWWSTATTARARIGENATPHLDPGDDSESKE